MTELSVAAIRALERAHPERMILPPVNRDRTKYQTLPPLARAQYEALKADIARQGIVTPIEVDEAGHILDGHNREAIARELRIPCPRIVIPGLTDADKRAHALRSNLLRRQLSPAAWGVAFAMLLELRGVKRGRGTRNDRRKTGNLTSPTIGEVAKELGVSESTAFGRLAKAKQRTAAASTKVATTPALTPPRATKHPTIATATPRDWHAALTAILRDARRQGVSRAAILAVVDNVLSPSPRD